MDLSPFKRDIDELIDEFVEGEFMTMADMKSVWLSRKFSYIYEASPSTNLVIFMQSLYAYAIGHMISIASLSRRLGGLYCLYCLHETQPFKPPFRIYLSLGELKKLRELLVDAKEMGIKVVPALVKKMLENNMFLFGSVDLNEGSVSDMVNQLAELQNARVKVAYDKLFANTRIEHFLHMNMGAEIDLNVLKNISAEYSDAKKQAIKEASAVVDVENIQHITDDKELIGGVVEKIAENWDAQRMLFYQQTGLKWECFQQHKQPHDKENDENENSHREIISQQTELDGPAQQDLVRLQHKQQAADEAYSYVLEEMLLSQVDGEPEGEKGEEEKGK